MMMSVMMMSLFMIMIVVMLSLMIVIVVMLSLMIVIVVMLSLVIVIVVMLSLVIVIMVVMPLFIWLFLLTVKDHSHMSTRYPGFLNHFSLVFSFRNAKRIEFRKHFLPVLKQFQKSCGEHVPCGAHSKIQI